MIARLLWICLGCVVTLAVSWAQGKLEMSEADLRILWPAQAAAPIEWAVNAGADAAAGQAWHSLISHGPEGGALSRHLRLDGAAIVFGEWMQNAEGTFARSGRTGNGAFEVTEVLSRDENRDFRVKLTVTIKRHPEPAPQGDGPELTLSIGPGLGEAPDPGFGYARGIYSFVEAIGSIGGQLVTYPPRGDRQAHLLESEQAEALDWIGLHSRYFALILAPTAASAKVTSALARPESREISKALPPNFLPSVSLALGSDRLAAGEARHWEFIVFSGPKARAALAAAGNDISQLLFPNLWKWMRWLSFGLWSVLAAIHSVIPNWGVTILVLAVLVRLGLYPLAKAAYRKQMRFAAAQEAMKPELAKFNKIADGVERNERILALYKQHGVSPAAGMMPLLIILLQIPIFVALFHLLGQAFELRSASFLWMDSLAQPDQLFHFGFELPLLGAYFNLLPVLMAVTTVASIMSPPPAGETNSLLTANNIFFFFVAMIFLILLYPFPSGMVLYWTAANVLHLGQSLWHRWHAQAPRAAL